MEYNENVSLYGEVAAGKIAAASDVLTLINFVKYGNKADVEAVYADLGEILGVGDSTATTETPATSSESVPATSSAPAVSEAPATSEAPVSSTTPPSATTNTNSTTSTADGIITTK